MPTSSNPRLTNLIPSFKLTSSSTHSSAYCLFGTAYNNQYFRYPTCEITTGNDIWFALNTPSTSSTWPGNLQLSVGLNQNLMEFGKINYYKFSYVRDNQTLAIYHSLDGETWTSVGSKDITSALNGGTLYNDTTYDFCIGGNALASSIAFPCNDDNHICIDKCKIISEGNIIFGWDSKKVLTGEAIIEEPTVYEVDCTSEVYNSLPLHDSHTIYNVLNQDDSVNKYLGEDLIGGTVDNLGEIVPKNYENETRFFEDRNIIYETKCTSTKYNSMSNHSGNVLYSVLQPDNKVYKYLGDHQVGVDKTDIGSIDISNSTTDYIKTSMIIDQTEDFEFVICFTMPSGNHEYNLAGNSDMLGIGATISNNSSDNTKAEGGFQFFVDSGGWENNIAMVACPSAALIADGVTKNYIKFERKGDYLYASYSLDGKNFILETTQAVPTGRTFSTEEPIYLGKVYPNYSDTLNLLSFCLSECYLKQNGQIVFGNDLKPVNFAGENIDTDEYAVVPYVARGNLFDYTKKRTENGYRNHAGLEPSNPQTYESDMSSYAPVSYISEYIPVEAGVKYFRIIPEFTWNWPGIVIYNANKEFLSFIESARASYQEITMPENAAYVRLSICDTTGISLTTCPDFERLCSFCRA